MSENKISLGKILQQKRQNLGLEIAQLAKALKVKETIIIEIEDDKIEQLQERKIYAFGIVRSYAKFLKIDQKIIDAEINLLHFKSNTENKSHLLINIGEEDKLTPSKDEFLKFLLISLLLFVISLAFYNFSLSREEISNEEVILKLNQSDGN